MTEFHQATVVAGLFTGVKKPNGSMCIDKQSLLLKFHKDLQVNKDERIRVYIQLCIDQLEHFTFN